MLNNIDFRIDVIFKCAKSIHMYYVHCKGYPMARNLTVRKSNTFKIHNVSHLYIFKQGLECSKYHSYILSKFKFSFLAFLSCLYIFRRNIFKF